MNVSVKLAGSLDSSTDRHRKIGYELSNHATLGDLLDLLDQQFPGLKSSICSDRKVVDHINVYVNGDNVRYVHGLDTELNDGDAVYIIPAAAAG